MIIELFEITEDKCKCGTDLYQFNRLISCPICGFYRVIKRRYFAKEPDTSNDKYITDNYLLRPLVHICRDLNISIKVGERVLRRLKLIRPTDLCNKFKTTHRGLNDPKPKSKNCYKPKPKIAKIKIPKITKKPELILTSKNVDYSTKTLVKIDNKTWIYKEKI